MLDEGKKAVETGYDRWFCGWIRDLPFAEEGRLSCVQKENDQRRWQ
jgi:hypothetical protein